MECRWLTLDDFGAYAKLVYTVSENMTANGKSSQVDFLSLPECYKAVLEHRVFSMWDKDVLVAVLISGRCNLSEIYEGQFEDLDSKATYLRNGMVHPDYIGRGLYSQFMQAVAKIIKGDLVGTITPDNMGAQYACASAGFTIIQTIPYLKKAASVVLMVRSKNATALEEYSSAA